MRRHRFSMKGHTPVRLGTTELDIMLSENVDDDQVFGVPLQHSPRNKAELACLFVGVQQTVNTLQTLYVPANTSSDSNCTLNFIPIITGLITSESLWLQRVCTIVVISAIENPSFLKPYLLLSCTLCAGLVLMLVSALQAGVRTKPPTESLMCASADQRCQSMDLPGAPLFHLTCLSVCCFPFSVKGQCVIQVHTIIHTYKILDTPFRTL